jgi:hypothetical protein
MTPAERGMNPEEGGASGFRHMGNQMSTRRVGAPIHRIPSSQIPSPDTIPEGRGRIGQVCKSPTPEKSPLAPVTMIPSNPSSLSVGGMQRAIEITAVAKAPESTETIDLEQYVPQKINVDEVETRQVSVDLAEKLKGKTVEDLLELEWLSVQRSVPGKDGQLKLTEARSAPLIDGTLDHPRSEVPVEMVDLQQFSLHLQSLLYSALSSNIRTYTGSTPAPDTVVNTEVAIIVDVNASMTTLSPGKLMAAEILAVGFGTILSDFGVPVSLFAFGDRTAIWRLTDPANRNISTELLRMVDALRSGGRVGSYPLDAILSAESDWASRRDRTRGAVQGAENHLTILISDFLSPQVLDRKRNWSITPGLGRCVLLALDTEWNERILDQKKIPRTLYEKGLIPLTTSTDRSIAIFRLNPIEICSGIPSETSLLPEVVGSVVSLLITRTILPKQLTNVTARARPPVLDSSPVWIQLGKTHEKADDIAKDVFFQVQASQKFPSPIDDGKSGVKVQVPEHLELAREWLDRKGGVSGQSPFDGLAKDIATMALTHSFVPNLAAGKEPSSSSGELWIDGLRRFIASGYTYQYLFRKKSGRNQKAYAITILIDNVRRLFSPFNTYHTLSHIAAVLGSLPLVPESDDIIADLICASAGEVIVLMNGIPVRHFSDGGLISDIIRTAERFSGLESGLGCGCQAALQIAARRSGVGLGRRIFVLSDGIVSSPAEFNAFQSALIDCESSGIDVLGIGVGIAPFHIAELFPVCLYSPNPADLGVAMAAVLGVSIKASASGISSRELYHQPEANKMQEIRDRLCKSGPQFCPALGSSIKDRPLSIDFLEALGDTDILMMRNSANSLTTNPEQEPYNDGIFDGFAILIVCLYMGAYEKNNQITKAVFDRDCGRVLKRKGFAYTFVCSYGEGIAQLTRNEGGRCPFTQLWLFSSPGYGELPNEATDKDVNKIVPFMNAVNDFRTGGGALLLFCDNVPYIFEANYLLGNYLTFSHPGGSGRTNLRFGGLSCTGASGSQFNGWIGKQQISVAATESPARQGFTPKVELPAPGKCNRRLSLRPGLVKFYEGNTISYAVNPSGQPITSESDLWPFTPFAWTSENVSPPRPFILFHDPEITSDTFECPGPVVIHGGFTSAFYEFGDDKSGGTGRLIISIACWLTRMEERMYQAKVTASPIVKSVKRLTGNYSVSGSFTDFQPKPSSRHSILCLDVSGSMDRDYAQLAKGANDYINIQRGWGGLIPIVQFDDSARILYERGTRNIGAREGFTDGGTDFSAALKVALQVIGRNPSGYECRILFFTDGGASIPTTELQTLRSQGIRMDVVGYGGGSEKVLKQLVTCGGQVTIGRTINDVQDVFRATAADVFRAIAAAD